MLVEGLEVVVGGMDGGPARVDDGIGDGVAVAIFGKRVLWFRLCCVRIP